MSLGRGYRKTLADPTPQYVLIDGSRNMRKVKVTGLTTAERDALNLGSNDRALIYNNTTSQWEGWTGTSWDGLGASTSNHITIQASAYNATVSGTWAYLTSLDGVAGFWINSTKDNGDEINYKVYLPVGTYSMWIVGGKHTDYGIVDVDIDGAEVASFDFYYSQAIAFWELTDLRQTGIAIGESGLKTLTLRLDGKHASSTGYGCAIREICIWRTA